MALLVLSACASTSSFDGVEGQGTERAEGASDADRLRAERVVYAGLARGVERYELAPGDVLRVLFTADPRARTEEYRIGIRDKLRVDFFYNAEASRTVVVRPDGRITLPLKGEIVAAGMTAGALAARLRELYQDVYREPVVTVSVEEFTSPLSEINDSLKTSQDGRAKQVVIAPDGLAFLPFVPPLKASGRTVDQFQDEVNRIYAERVGSIAVSVSLERVDGDRLFVFGEVRNPGMQASSRPQTALQVISAAGGPLNTGAMESVKVVYWTGDGESKMRTLDLEGLIEGRKAGEDMLLPANTIVYVPPTNIAKLNRFVDQYIKQLFLFNGVNATFNMLYELNRQSATVLVP